MVDRQIKHIYLDLHAALLSFTSPLHAIDSSLSEAQAPYRVRATYIPLTHDSSDSSRPPTTSSRLNRVFRHSLYQSIPLHVNHVYLHGCRCRLTPRRRSASRTGIRPNVSPLSPPPHETLIVCAQWPSLFIQDPSRSHCIPLERFRACTQLWRRQYDLQGLDIRWVKEQ
jgi:hypothetical protein